MKTKVEAKEYIELYYDKKKSIYTWMFLPSTKSMTIEKLKETFGFMMSTMKTYSPEYVIADDRENLAVFTVEIQEWVAKTTIEGLVLSKVKKFAILRPKELINDMATEQAVDEARGLAKGIEIDIFSDYDEAEKWIMP